MKKNDTLVLTCQTLGSNMEGICRHENMVVFVPGLLPGEKAQVQIVKVQSSYAYGRMLENPDIPSTIRRNTDCTAFPKCGGCSCRHVDYQATLSTKKDIVSHCFHSIAHLDPEVSDVIGMQNPYHYRNKTSFPIQGTANHPLIGFYAPRSHRIIPCSNCPNAAEPVQSILSTFENWIKTYHIAPYQEETGKGILRHIMIRTNHQNESLVTIVLNSTNSDCLSSLVAPLLPLHVIGLIANYNRKKTNVILGPDYETVYGQSTLIDQIGDHNYEISPASFFQVNRDQTKILYDVIASLADLKPYESVADVYCGAGTISLYIAQHCKEVTGIEIVPQAIENAERNAMLNHITNAHFLCSPAEAALPELVQNGYRPDVVIVDPPRKGLNPKVIEAIGIVSPSRLVYVSCNPSTLARDVKAFTEFGYNIKTVQPVDLFAWTSDVETCCLLTRD